MVFKMTPYDSSHRLYPLGENPMNIGNKRSPTSHKVTTLTQAEIYLIHIFLIQKYIIIEMLKY